MLTGARRPTRYVLDGRTPRPVANEIEWARWRSTQTRPPRATVRVAATERDGVSVSTVFLGIDHSYSLNLNDPPILFETMVFAADRPDIDEQTWRYATYDEAERGHAAVCAWLWDGGAKPGEDR